MYVYDNILFKKGIDSNSNMFYILKYNNKIYSIKMLNFITMHNNYDIKYNLPIIII